MSTCPVQASTSVKAHTLTNPFSNDHNATQFDARIAAEEQSRRDKAAAARSRSFAQTNSRTAPGGAFAGSASVAVAAESSRSNDAGPSAHASSSRDALPLASWAPRGASDAASRSRFASASQPCSTQSAVYYAERTNDDDAKDADMVPPRRTNDGDEQLPSAADAQPVGVGSFPIKMEDYIDDDDNVPIMSLLSGGEREARYEHCAAPSSRPTGQAQAADPTLAGINQEALKELNDIFGNGEDSTWAFVKGDREDEDDAEYEQNVADGLTGVQGKDVSSFTCAYMRLR